MINDNLLNYDIDYNLIKNISKDILKTNEIIPLQKNELFIFVATSNITQDVNNINKIFNFPIKFIPISIKDLKFEFEYLDFKLKLFELANNALNLLHLENENSYIQELLKITFEFTISKNVSDIHIECLDKSVIFRFRVDGVLNQYFRFRIELYPLLSSIIKFFSNLDISQRRLPLSGRFTQDIYNEKFDFRVSTIPTIFGESIVIRILDNKNIQKDLSKIGFEHNTLNIIQKNLNLTQGLILVTGPTGSGKTTTLYSMLNQLNSKEKKIITIEDPVEYKLDGIIQININNEIELDYHTVLKNILRQDPDILMIGEIRDTLSLHIALRASLTGHLVIATLHTNNSVETISRLLDLKAEPYLIATTLKMVLSQRLLRKLCNNCKSFKHSINSYKNNGCKECNFTGYKDRQIVSEILEIDTNIAQMISKNASAIDILNTSKINGFLTLQEHGKLLVDKGITTLSEYYSKISNEI